MELIIAGAMLGASLIVLLISLLTMLLTRRNLVEYSRKLSGTLDAMIAGDRDIAFEEEKETLIGKLQVKMRRLYEIMESQNERMAREKQQIEETIGDISHQVRTPVANLRMYHELLEQELEKSSRPWRGREEQQGEDEPGGQSRQFIEAQRRQIDKVEFLMDSMIKMSRLEAGLIRVKPCRGRVSDLIFQALCAAGPKAEEREIDIQVDCSGELYAWFDEKWTGEALFNLLDNAVKYNHRGGHIWIDARATDYFVRIRVRDDGRGIREEDLNDIFKRFYRAKESADTEGVGIGLYLTRQIVTCQKGFVEACRGESGGAVFSIHLPLEREEFSETA